MHDHTKGEGRGRTHGADGRSRVALDGTPPPRVEHNNTIRILRHDRARDGLPALPRRGPGSTSPGLSSSRPSRFSTGSYL